MTGDPVTLTPRLQSIMARATEFQRERGANVVGVEHVMIAILEDPDSVPTQVLDRFVDPPRVQQALVGLIDSDYVMTGEDGDTDVPAEVDRLAARRRRQRAGRVAEARDECAELVDSCLRELGPDHVVTRGVAARCADLRA